MSDELVPVPVPVHFHGIVDVLVPASVPEARRRELANKVALARVVATTDNPDAPELEACEDYQTTFGLDGEVASADWDGCQTPGVSGGWGGPGD